MKFLLLLILFISGYTISLAQARVQYDSASVQVRPINPQVINAYKQDKNFQYRQEEAPAPNLWERFKAWVWYKIAQLMRTRSGKVTVWTLVVIVALAVIAFFVFKVMGMSRDSLFARNSDDSLPYSITSDDIHAISFDEAIQQAIGNGDFRQAIRLLYLQSLKRLSDRGYIEWKINKTNSDYINEVRERQWHSLFRMLTMRFEYAWYGERNIDKNDFENLRGEFRQLYNQL